MGEVVVVGLDIAKSVFQAHGVDADGQAVIKRRLTRAKLIPFFESLPRCLIGIEACATAHHWGPRLSAPGHEVKLMPPSYVKPYVKRQKNDAADAEAICEAVTELIEYLLDGDLTGFSPARLTTSTRLLASDLQRNLPPGWTCVVDAPVDGPTGKVAAPILMTDPRGRAQVVALSGPLTDGQPADLAVAELREAQRTIRVHVENELVVRRNLPFATRTVLQKVQ